MVFGSLKPGIIILMVSFNIESLLTFKSSMVKIINIFFGILISFSVSSQDTISIKQMGYQPGSRENVVPIITKALLQCKAKDKSVLVFPKGRYDFWQENSAEFELYESNTDVIPFRICPILIKNINNLTIDANGSDFIFHGRMQPISIINSNQIKIKNVTIDWDIPMTAQAEVVAVSENYIDIKINVVESPYIIEKNKLIFLGEGWRSQFWDVMEYDKNSKLIVPQTDDNCLGTNWTNYLASEVERGVIRLNFTFTRKPAIGNFLVLRHSARDHAGTFIQNSKNIKLENFNLYQTAGLGVLSQYSENLIFKNVHCEPNLSKNRIFSGHDDGLHFSNCKGKILVDSCRFSGLMDDPINVHGTSVLITEKKSSKVLNCKFVHPQSIGFIWAEINDKIGFIENESMSTVGFGKVSLLKIISLEEFEITFMDAIPDEIIAGDALENLTWTPDVSIRNSYFGSNRARGILISTPGDVLIENNIFETSGSAILIPGDANGWYESGAVKHVIIRKNIFKEACLTSVYQFCEAIISIDPEIPKPQANKLFHRNIRIEQNIFHPFDYPVLYAKSTDGLFFNNNTIQRSTKYSSFHNRKYMISLEGCKKVEILDNLLIGDVLGKNILLKGTAIKELRSDKSLQVVLFQ